MLPAAFVNVACDPNAFDVNVTPDKRTVMFGEEGKLLALVRSMLDDLFSADACTLSTVEAPSPSPRSHPPPPPPPRPPGRPPGRPPWSADPPHSIAINADEPLTEASGAAIVANVVGGLAALDADYGSDGNVMPG